MRQAGQPAPDMGVTLFDGSKERLSAFWQSQKLVLVFLRHLGWLFCRQQVAQLRQHKGAFDNAGIRIVLASMGTPEQTAAFKQRLGVPFTMLSDPERRLYLSMKIGLMSLTSTFSPGMVIKVGAALAKGHGIGIPHGDIRQLPALFIINTDGKITFAHYGQDAADHLSPEQILVRL